MKLKYEFKDKSLLEMALTQSGADILHNNERLEFVGDRVLGLSVAALLYEMFPSEDEGQLARRHAFLVSTETLADVALALGFITSVLFNQIWSNQFCQILNEVNYLGKI